MDGITEATATHSNCKLLPIAVLFNGACSAYTTDPSGLCFGRGASCCVVFVLILSSIVGFGLTDSELGEDNILPGMESIESEAVLLGREGDDDDDGEGGIGKVRASEMRRCESMNVGGLRSIRDSSTSQVPFG